MSVPPGEKPKLKFTPLQTAVLGMVGGYLLSRIEPEMRESSGASRPTTNPGGLLGLLAANPEEQIDFVKR